MTRRISLLLDLANIKYTLAPNGQISVMFSLFLFSPIVQYEQYKEIKQDLINNTPHISAVPLPST
jgi:hypothetical protein